MAVADRAKALEAALAQIEKQHGKGSVMRLGDETRLPMEVIPIMAFMGVRISWLIRDKNSPLARLACSAASFA